MTLDEIRAAVLRSTRADWNAITTDLPVVAPHDHYAAYRPDLAVGLAWGHTLNEHFYEEWANRHPDPAASSFLVDIACNGVVVDRHVGVLVDGGRCGLPLAHQEFLQDPLQVEPGTIVVNYQGTAAQCALFRLVHEMWGDGAVFDQYVGRAGLEVIEGGLGA